MDVKDLEGGTKEFILRKVAYVPSYHTSVVSENQLEECGFWKNGYTRTLNYGEPGKDWEICLLQKMYNQNVLEYNEKSPYLQVPFSYAGLLLAIRR